MNIQIVSHWDKSKVLFEADKNNIKLVIELAINCSANLSCANLSGVDLRSAKGYLNSHDFFQELIRRIPITDVKKEWWEIIGKIMTYRWCWPKLTQEIGSSALPLLEKYAEMGFDEYLIKAKEILNIK